MQYLHDATEGDRGFRGHADAVVLPASTEEVARVLAWCYEQEVALVPRGGGTGFAGGAVPFGGVVLSLERMTRIRAFEPLLWRMCVEAGVTTGTIHRLARENGLFFPPDPGAAEQSQIGGNVATNAGGPHAFKYGVTGRWVTGLEAVIPPGEVLMVGGPIRKDVAGYDLKSLLIGSEGTLGVITAVWLRLVPAPERVQAVVAFYPDSETGCAAIERLLASGVEAAAVEYADEGALRLSAPVFPAPVPGEARFLVLAEADGSAAEIERVTAELQEALTEDALGFYAPDDRGGVWRWRESVSGAVRGSRGRKLSEDVVVPLDRLADAIAETRRIGARLELESCSFGHAGDGNLHSSFLFAPDDPDAAERAAAAAEALAEYVVGVGGSISGEHGVGLLKRAHVGFQFGERVLGLEEEIKRAFDPKGLLNPGKKVG